MAEIRSINALRATREDNNELLSPIECLEDAVADLRSGVKINKVLVIGLNTEADGGTGYDVRYWTAHLRSSEMLSLVEAFKVITIRNMDLI